LGKGVLRKERMVSGRFAKVRREYDLYFVIISLIK
jgi:hypothetical protein